MSKLAPYHLEAVDLLFDSTSYLFVRGWTLDDRLDISGLSAADHGLHLRFASTSYVPRQDVTDYARDQGVPLKRPPTGFVAMYRILPESHGGRRFDTLTLVNTRDGQVFAGLPVNRVPRFEAARAFTGPETFPAGSMETAVIERLAGGHDFNSTEGAPWLDKAGPAGPHFWGCEGWLEDVTQYRLALFDPNTLELARLHVQSLRRDDVQEHLLKEGHTPQTLIHGFKAWAWVEDSRRPYVLLAMGPKDLKILNLAAHGPAADAQAAQAIAADMLSFHLRQPSDALRLIIDALETGGRDGPAPESLFAASSATVVRPVQGRTDVSVVVPFHGNGFFFPDIIDMQARSPEGFQWIVVCDDPSLQGEMNVYLHEHAALIRRPFILVSTPGSSGFATASNIGAAHADGQHILFMNSDVYLRGFEGLLAGLDHIRRQPDDVVGFVLTYEDNSIQHVGIDFFRSASYGHLILADHPAKGLPWRPPVVPVARPVSAVTGALMLVTRAGNGFHEYFDSAYINGDFEDVDLCLRHRERGGKCVLVEAGGMYHLERQSIGRLSGGQRHLFTLKNAHLFTTRWETWLDARGDVR